MPTRTSTRPAAVKANEALQKNTRTSTKKAGAKRKGSEETAPRTKRGRKIDDVHEEKAAPTEQEPRERSKGHLKQENGEQNRHDTDGGKEEADTHKEAKAEKKPGWEAESKEEKKNNTAQEETPIKRSDERQESLPSNILEKGLVYFFFRSRVSVEDPESVKDVARTFIVLRPVLLDAELGKGPIPDEDNCRLLVLPKKQLPSSSRERYMGFVEKAGVSLKTIKESFRGSEYDTKTRGHQEVPSATPFAEGVYAITSTDRTSHLAYILTLPQELSEVQSDLGLSKQGSFIVSVKSPKFSGPASARLPKSPEYPQE